MGLSQPARPYSNYRQPTRRTRPIDHTRLQFQFFVYGQLHPDRTKQRQFRKPVRELADDVHGDRIFERYSQFPDSSGQLNLDERPEHSMFVHRSAALHSPGG